MTSQQDRYLTLFIGDEASITPSSLSIARDFSGATKPRRHSISCSFHGSLEISQNQDIYDSKFSEVIGKQLIHFVRSPLLWQGIKINRN